MADESRLVIAIDARNAEKTASALNKELQSMTNYGNKADKQVNVLGSSVRSLAGYMAGLATVSTAISKMDAYTNLQNRLKLVTNSQQDLNKATEDTYKIALKTYQSWDSVVQVYQRFSDNAKTLNIDMAKTAQLTETVSKAVAISGASTQAAEAALTQFGQALASGVLRGEELNSVMEQTPALAKAIAQGMGITVGQLRSVAAEGKITSDVLVKALGNAAADVDDKFSKMQMTIGQSMTNLDTQITKFAENTTGAASTIANSIALIANNLEAITGGAMVIGIGYLTTAIVTKTTAITADTTALLAQRAATAAQTAEELRLAQAAAASAVAEVAGTEAKIASLTATRALLIEEAKAELQRKRSQISTQGAINSELRLGLIRNQMRATTAEMAAAETALAASRAKAAATQAASAAATTGALTAGRALLGVLGGPVGIGITVASLAAGYLLMRDNTAEATAKLETQASIANKTREELLKLQGVQREGAKSDLAEAFTAQNKALKESNFLFNSRVIAIQNANKGNTEIVDISNKVRQGLISQKDALAELNKIKYVTPEQLKQLQNAADHYEENRVKAQRTADAQAVYGTKSKLAGNDAQNAAGKVDSNSSSLDKNADAANNAAEAQSKYLNQLRKSNVEVLMTNKLIDQGWSVDRAKATAKAYSETGKVTKDTIQLIDQNIAANNKLKVTEGAISNAKKSSSSSSKSAASQAKKDAKDRENMLKEQSSMREQIAYENADRLKKIELDLAREIADIQKANFGGTDTSNLIDVAKNRADIEKKIFIAQSEFEINQYRYNEEQKLKKTLEINQLILQANTDNDDQLFDAYADSLEERYEEELAQIKLTQKQRLLSADQVFLSDIDYIKRKYELEREELAKTKDAEERMALMSSSFANQSNEESAIRDTAISNYNSEMGIEEHPLAQQFKALDEMRKLDLINEEKYQQDKLKLQMVYMNSYMGDLFGGFSKMVDENSKTYNILFAAQKAFAVANALINIPNAYSKAYDAVVGTPYIGPYIAPVAGAAAAAIQVAQAAQIKSVNMTGYKDGGYTGNIGVSQEAGVVHGQEYVLNAEATKRVGVGTLDAINNGGNLPKQTQAVSGGDVNLKMINVVDARMVGDFMNTSDGEKVMLNFIRNNKSEVQRIVR